MTEFFDPAEKSLLKDLSVKPTWQSILAKLGEVKRPIPPYKPGKGEIEKQVADWKYSSGIDRGGRDLLKLLSDE